MRIVVTAGPTREHLDPVRFLSNPSTGRMGFAVARAAAARGHEVVLVAGPVALKTPPGVRRVDVVSAREMHKAALDAAKGADVFVATAAVADFRPETCAANKLKKGAMPTTLKLVRNRDILKDAPTRFKVGFAAETDHVLSHALKKCREKRLAFVVANDVTEAGSGFGVSTNRVVFVFPDGTTEPLPRMSKRRVAEAILSRIEKCLP